MIWRNCDRQERISFFFITLQFTLSIHILLVADSVYKFNDNGYRKSFLKVSIAARRRERFARLNDQTYVFGYEMSR